MTEKSKICDVIGCDNPWNSNNNEIWLGSTLKLYRNLEKFQYPNKIASDRRHQVLNMVGASLINVNQLDKPVMIRGEELTPTDKELLFERYLPVNSFHQAHSGEAVVLDRSGQFLAVLNIRDHIQLMITDSSGELESAWNRLVDIESTLGSDVGFAFNRKFGFLNADPSTCGTGLVIYAYLQVPALIHTGGLGDAVKSACSNNRISTTGLMGDPDQLTGDVLALYNACTLGISEEDIVSQLRAAVTRIQVAEKGARSRIASEDDPHIKDLVSRAYGLLAHSYQIETQEMMGALSLLKLGADLGWISGLSASDYNSLFFGCRRGHLVAGSQNIENQDHEAVLHLRAEKIHAALCDAELKI